MVKKLGMCVATMFVSLLLTFFVIEIMPGDPVDTLAQEYVRTQNLIYEVAYQKAKNALNYDPTIPVSERFINYTIGALTGDLGQSMSFKQSVNTIVLGALPWTLLVCTLSLSLAFTIGVLLGIYIAWKRSKPLDTILTIAQSIFGAIPDYIVGYLFIILFAVHLGWFPARGSYSSSVVPAFSVEFILSVLWHCILPVFTVFITTVTGWIISMKAMALSVLGEDYIHYAKARGISQKRILITYVGRNSILPMITSVAISFGFMFGGSPLIENLFVYPGIGYYLGQAINRRDYPLMQGMFLMIIMMVLIAGLVAEFLYAKLNPRLREE
ncbi:peptide ABC transporter permease [Candidatus Epulonipiscium fishelsonii]|uniref:Peptide ABC transporter permease n=1 Tax=Candidatus Epulonipiscium fishelsonii TaxID=77094 RepID=A0ACC8X8V7_9FIRM|nr:peptide ABC transporter permease [Epulopiscium sp. SCG-B11WGA-EpuloA1]